MNWIERKEKKGEEGSWWADWFPMASWFGDNGPDRKQITQKVDVNLIEFQI